MKYIDLTKELKQQFETEGLTYPKLKYNNKYGLPKSSLLENNNLSICLYDLLKYLYEKNIIDFDAKIYFNKLDNKEVLK